MWKRRLLFAAILILSLVWLSLTAYHDNALREAAMAEACLKKIWIVSDWDGRSGTYRDIYFFFDTIEEQRCEGGFKTGISQLWGDDYLRNAGNPFSGVIDGNTAKCRFVDYEGRTGDLVFVFVNENEIEATISYDGEDTTERKTLRPYNIRDMEEFTLQGKPVVQTELGHWGQVSFVAGIYRGGGKPCPEAYLVNENYDILYGFKASFHTGTKIYDVVFKDVNEDGSEDVVISTCFADGDAEDAGMLHIHWYFQQTDTCFQLETVWYEEPKGRRAEPLTKDKGAETDVEEEGMYGRNTC